MARFTDSSSCRVAAIVIRDRMPADISAAACDAVFRATRDYAEPRGKVRYFTEEPVSRLESNWQYAEQYPTESDAQIRARRLSLELGIEPVSRATAAALSALVAATGAQSILEVGTGVGVSGLALLRHAPTAHLTSIERESEFMRQARTIFADADIANARLRLIEGDAAQVLPRLNLGTYDLVILDEDPLRLLEDVELALQIVRTGGTIAVVGAFAHGRVPDPAARDAVTQNMRDLLSMVADSPAIAAALSPAGDGLLTMTRIDVRN